MIRIRKSAAEAAIGLSSVFLLLTITVSGPQTWAQTGPGPMEQPSQTPAIKTAAEAYKNIKVLKDIPANELIPTMEFISASLGVRCEFCHVEHHFDDDAKKPKQRAREMMQMMFAINKDSFHGNLEVTCNTCHNGSQHPAGMPAIAEDGETPMQPAHAEENGGRTNFASLPQPSAIVANYVQALGGANALGKIKSRVITGTMTAFGHALPVEIYTKAPDQRAMVMKFPRGESVTTFNGHEGWMSMMPRPPHPLEGSELDRESLEADFYFPLDLQKVFTSLRERPPQKVGDEEAYVVLGIRPGKPPMQLFFGEKSGLLLRMVYFTQTPLGRLPQQTDFSDFREVDGVKVPFQWTVADPRSRSTVQVAQVQQNVPVSESKFSIPATPGPAGQ
ncbi:MAG: c-type cytochrome [Acidobacteria bacterium]|nr:MAG: c-type cytochrome [Acidobacteriota bacterium]